MSTPNNKVPRKRTACVGCYEAKQRCDFVESMGACHRCLGRGMKCVPRVSRQGQRPNKPKKEKGTAATSRGGENKQSQNHANKEILNNSHYVSSSDATAAATLHNGHVIGIEPPQHPQQLQGFSGNFGADQMQQCQQNLEIQNDLQYASSSGAASAATLHNGYVMGIEPPQQVQQLQGFSGNFGADQMQQCQQNLEIQNNLQYASSSCAASAATLHNGYVMGIEPPQQVQQLQGYSFNSAVEEIQQCQPFFFAEEQKSLMRQYQPILSSQPENQITKNMGPGSTFPSSANRYNKTEQIHLTQDYNTNRMPSSSATAESFMPFKQWINQALAAVSVSDGSPAIASVAYLNAALKIAISLTRQFASNESDAAPPISSAINWSARTVVGFVQKDESGEQSFDDQLPVSFADKTEKKPSRTIGDALDDDVDKELESFFKTAFVDDVVGIDKIPGNLDQKIDIFLKSFDDSATKKKTGLHDMLPPPSLQESQECNEHLSCEDKPAAFRPYDSGVFDVDSAEILCPKKGPNSIESFHSTNEIRRQIYYLGLIFYELFSGGEVPEPSLYSLALCQNAFVSLSILTLVEEENREPIIPNEYKRFQGPNKSESNLGLCQQSCEYLRVRGVPSPVCNLIGNMLNCVYGESCGKEAYTNLADVMSDLQLMINKPGKFLRCLNTSELTLTGLPMHEFVVPREEEKDIIKSCYHRSIAGSYEHAIIKGESGSGKSCLAQSIGNFIISEGGLFLTGKFCQMRQGVPFSALTSAFDQYCDVLMQNEQTSWARSVVKGLKDALAQDAVYLIRVIPKLGKVLDHDVSPAAGDVSAIYDSNATNASKRLHYLFCRFVEVISSWSGMQIALHLDDLQWADDASVAVLNHILRQKCNNFFFMGCYRDDDILPGHPVLVMLENIRQIGVYATMVELKGIEVDTLNLILSDLLCISPRLVRPLSSIIHTKTRGNTLFVSQLLLSLYRDGLLLIDNDRQRWKWDEDEIISKKLPDNIATCFTNGITKLHLDVQTALHTLSIIGSSVKVDYIRVLESQLGLNLSAPLQRSVMDGLISKYNGAYHFCHDRIQEASYELIQDPVRRNSHLMCGTCLVQHAIDTNDWDLFFVAVNQINLAGPASVSNPLDRFMMVRHNMDAGKRSMAISDFSSAYSFFDNGISFLSEGDWGNHYSVCIELHELAAQTALAAGNIQCVSTLSNEIFNKAANFMDTLNAHFVIISSLLSSSQMKIAMEKGVVILSKLGEEVPSNLSPEELKQRSQQTVNSVTGILPCIMSYKTMTDKKKLFAMKFLSQLFMTSHHAQPAFVPNVIMKMIELTVSHGLSREALVAFATYGSFLARLGHIELGSQLTVIAQSLIHKLNAHGFAGQILFVVADIQRCMQPLLAANELRIEGERLALAVGDVHYGCAHRLHHVITLFISGIELETVQQQFSHARKFVEEHEHNASVAYLLVTQRIISSLMGNDCDASTLEDLDVEVSQQHEVHLISQNMYLSLLMDKDDLAELCEKFLEVDKGVSVMLLLNLIRSLYVGLSSFRVYRKTLDPIWLERGKTKCRYLKEWAEKGSTWNFENKLMLLQAEESYCDGNVEGAKSLYDAAISSARRHKFINEEALAYELAARFYFETGDEGTSLHLFSKARQKYEEWGAFGKASRLSIDMTKRFGDAISVSQSQTSST